MQLSKCVFIFAFLASARAGPPHHKNIRTPSHTHAFSRRRRLSHRWWSWSRRCWKWRSDTFWIPVFWTLLLSSRLPSVGGWEAESEPLSEERNETERPWPGDETYCSASSTCFQEERWHPPLLLHAALLNAAVILQERPLLPVSELHHLTQQQIFVFFLPCDLLCGKSLMISLLLFHPPLPPLFSP